MVSAKSRNGGGSRKRGERDHLSPQLTFGFQRREGHRVGRPIDPNSGVSHLKRGELASRFPVHVVLRLRGGLPALRTKRPFKVLRRSFAAGCERFGFRLNHYSVQNNHVHLIVEATDRQALSRGMTGLSVRIACGLNKLWGRKGRVFGDRYFDRILRTPREVKHALRYVLMNANHHGVRSDPTPDIFSSGMYFDGWQEFELEEFIVSEPPARTRLRRLGRRPPPPRR